MGGRGVKQSFHGVAESRMNRVKGRNEVQKVVGKGIPPPVIQALFWCLGGGGKEGETEMQVEGQECPCRVVSPGLGHHL